MEITHEEFLRACERSQQVIVYWTLVSNLEELPEERNVMEAHLLGPDTEQWPMSLEQCFRSFNEWTKHPIRHGEELARSVQKFLNRSRGESRPRRSVNTTQSTDSRSYKVVDAAAFPAQLANVVSHAASAWAVTGIYKKIDPKKPSSTFYEVWTPDLSIATKWDGWNALDVTLREFEELLDVWARVAGQATIYLELDETPYFYTPAAVKGEKPEIATYGRSRRWVVKNIPSDSLPADFTKYIQSLDLPADKGTYSRFGERMADWLHQIMPPKTTFIGGTFAESLAGGLEIRIAGWSRFFFECVFRPWIDDAKPDVESPFAILLDASDQALRYVWYIADDPGAADRCLCGDSYPRHDGPREWTHVQMRANAGQWIRDQYGELASCSEPWPKLSSPYFYLGEPDSIGSVDETRMKGTANDTWDELMSRTFSSEKSDAEDG